MVDDLHVSSVRKRPMRRPLPMAVFCTETARTPRTIRRHVAEPRAEYEARSLSRTAPWRAEGISRATWYRRRAYPQGRVLIP